MPRPGSLTGLGKLKRMRKREYEVLLAEARGFAERLRNVLPDARVWLYGSVARGDWNLHSDIDLLVVGGVPKDPLERSTFLYQFTTGREEPKGLTVAEFDHLKAQGKLWYMQDALEL
jgi:predicted nucleotidyltransferase